MSDVALSNWPANGNASPRQRLVELAARLSRTLALARGLIRGGRRLDMTGLDDGVGILCAQTLDLAPGEASALMPILRGLLTEVELLETAMRDRASCLEKPC